MAGGVGDDEGDDEENEAGDDDGDGNDTGGKEKNDARFSFDSTNGYFDLTGPSTFRNSYAKSRYFTRLPVTVVLCILFCVGGVVGVSPCHYKCNYIEEYQQANCENRSLDAIPRECNAASYLSLENNEIRSICPGTFVGFPFLKYLDLSYNKITIVENETFFGAHQLRSIKLSNNEVETIEFTAFNGGMKRLQSLYLSSNAINKIINGTFQRAPAIEFIDLFSNKLVNVPYGMFTKLGNLKRLYLGMNKITYLQDECFVGLNALLYLDLSKNSIKNLQETLFNDLISLNTVDLSDNELIQTGGVSNSPNLNRIDLRRNNLTSIDGLTELWLENVQYIYLEGNPWKCDSRLEPLRLWYQESDSRGVKYDFPNCSDPSEFKNKTINSLEISLFDYSEDQTATSPTQSDSTTPLLPFTGEAIEKDSHDNLTGEKRMTHSLSTKAAIFIVIGILMLSVMMFTKIYFHYRKIIK